MEWASSCLLVWSWRILASCKGSFSLHGIRDKSILIPCWSNVGPPCCIVYATNIQSSVCVERRVLECLTLVEQMGCCLLKVHFLFNSIVEKQEKPKRSPISRSSGLLKSWTSLIFLPYEWTLLRLSPIKSPSDLCFQIRLKQRIFYWGILVSVLFCVT